MQTVTTIEAVRAHVRAWRGAGQSVALVPTMGNLHAGHGSLLTLARRRASRVVASVFVNPIQFGPSEDFAAYPRTLAEDERLLDEAQCDLLFAPAVAEIYPNGGSQPTLVQVRGLSEILCGPFRPGHFDGVASVVAKLFGIVQPDLAVFGLKDYQQYMVIRRMTLDLALPVEVLGAPTVRAADGLALSSRNRYLSEEQRSRSLAIYQALHSAVAALRAGDRDYAALERAGWQGLERAGLQPEYFSILSALDLSAPAESRAADLIALTAARLGRARLIDNLRVAEL
ncbi:MAG TPA: pantoate--beta-alanine ligase [Steroidobacteraceae bacterium]|jgi:pantoate--beta-alanine ligase